MSAAAKSAFSKISKRLRQIEKHGDTKTLRDFMTGYEYAHLARAIDPDSLMRVFAILHDVNNTFEKRHPLIRPSKTRGWSKWPPERVQWLRDLDAKYGTDEDIARYMGITYDAARIARYRYVGPREPKAVPAQKAA